jgi:glycosyltransferase involved in cell wall biosynthesis
LEPLDWQRLAGNAARPFTAAQFRRTVSKDAWELLPFVAWLVDCCRPGLAVDLGGAGPLAILCGDPAPGSDLVANNIIRVSQADDGRDNVQVCKYGDGTEIAVVRGAPADQRFALSSIDFLYLGAGCGAQPVDGFYADWMPKLSQSGVVLIGGDSTLFPALAKHFPSFLLTRAGGLGVIAVGPQVPGLIGRLCATEGAEADAARALLACLGQALRERAESAIAVSRMASQLGEAEARNGGLNQQLDAARRELEYADAAQAVSADMRGLTEIRYESLKARYAARGQAGIPVRSSRSIIRGLLKPQAPEPADPIETVIRNSVHFDAVWYLDEYKDVANGNLDPAWHYLTYGAAEFRDPGPDFSTKLYHRMNPDLPVKGCNALYHFETEGEKEGRRFPSKRARPPQKPIVAPDLGVKLTGASPRIVFVSGEPSTPGHFYRVANYVTAANAAGAAAIWIDAQAFSERFETVCDCDILILWRAAWDPYIGAAIDLMHARNKIVVFDMDDLVVDPALAKPVYIDAIRSQDILEVRVREHFQLFRQTLAECDYCFTTTEELAYHSRLAGIVTFVTPNGFDSKTHRHYRKLARARDLAAPDGLIRIGYAGGSRTHQKDLGVCIEAVAAVLRENPACRLVLFRSPHDDLPLVDIAEFPQLAGLEGQFEWRDMRPWQDLPEEIARFAINLAPLELGNPFCEAKSELKFFEAALADVVTIATPTGPFRRAIEHGVTGFLAASADEWYHHLTQLVRSPEQRLRVGRAAYHAALGRFGPRLRAAHMQRVTGQLPGGREAAAGFALDVALKIKPRALPVVKPSQTMFAQDRGGEARVCVIVPLYNYAHYIIETLESVRAQTLPEIDLVIVDDCSTDDSLAVALDWVHANKDRFNRLIVLKHIVNAGLGFSRNLGFSAAETEYVLPLDADNRLLPDCAAVLLAAIEASGAGYVYPSIQLFGANDRLVSDVPYRPQRFAGANHIDAMALVAKEVWAAVGGYHHIRHGWEDYDFWARLAEAGLWGEWVPEVLAEYRVHPESMLRAETMVGDNYRRLVDDFSRRHPWVYLTDQEPKRARPSSRLGLTDPAQRTRLYMLSLILRCPASGERLVHDDDWTCLTAAGGWYRWPVSGGRPAFIAGAPRAPHLAHALAPPESFRMTSGRILLAGIARPVTQNAGVDWVTIGAPDDPTPEIIVSGTALPFDNAVFDAAFVALPWAMDAGIDPIGELQRILVPGAAVYFSGALPWRSLLARHFRVFATGPEASEAEFGGLSYSTAL